MNADLLRRLRCIALVGLDVDAPSDDALDRAVRRLSKNDPTYAGRLDALEVELDALPAKVDRMRVCDVLEAAKREAFAAAAVIDGNRWGAEYFGGRARRVADTRRALRDVLDVLPLEAEGDGQPSTARARQLATDLLGELATTQQRPEWKTRPAWPQTPQGRPVKPWNTRAKRALGALRVPREARDAILQAAGLILTPTVVENI
jgi:hypothetical protein